jgi:hypothetical protein
MGRGDYHDPESSSILSIAFQGVHWLTLMASCSLASGSARCPLHRRHHQNKLDQLKVGFA